MRTLLLVTAGFAYAQKPPRPRALTGSQTDVIII